MKALVTFSRILSGILGGIIFLFWITDEYTSIFEAILGVIGLILIVYAIFGKEVGYE